MLLSMMMADEKVAWASSVNSLDLVSTDEHRYLYFSEYNLTQPILSEEKLNEIRSIFEKI